MTDWSLAFGTANELGRVVRVDTGNVFARADDPDKLTRVAVGSLIAIQSSSAFEYLIGILDRVTREARLAFEIDDDESGAEDAPSFEDTVRVVAVGTLRTRQGQGGAAFRRGAHSYPLIDAPCWVLEGEALTGFMGLLAKDIDPAQRLSLGNFAADTAAKAIADGDRFFQRHAAILGSTGSGKSWAVALMLERAHALVNPNLIVFDMHGEYGPLSDPGDGQLAKGFKIVGPGAKGDESGQSLHLPWWLLNQEEMQALFLDRSEQNAPNQAARLSTHVRALKAETLAAGNHAQVLERFTVDSPVPFSLTQLLERLRADDSKMVPGTSTREKAGPFNGKLTRFIARLESRIDDRRYSFMFSKEDGTDDYEWLTRFANNFLGRSSGIKIIDFSEVPSEVLPIVVGVFARVLYELQFWTDSQSRTPVALVCDEAHLYLPAIEPDSAERRSLDAFERVAKEGRKYGMSLVVVSQRPSDVSRTILSQCNNFLVLRLTNDQDQRVVSRLVPDNMLGLISSLPLQDVGEAMLLGDAILLPTRIILDTPSVKPASATIDFWTIWNSTEAPVQDMEVAVNAMRMQSRPRSHGSA